MNFILHIFKVHLTINYFFIKIIFKQKKQVFLLSRQNNTLSLNYKEVINNLEKENIKYKVICKKVSTSINDSVRTQGNYSNTQGFMSKIFTNLKSVFEYYFSLHKQMAMIASSKVIIVDGYNLPVSLFRHKKGTKVIQMWHALGAIKKFGYQSVGKIDGISHDVARILKMHAGYDYVLSGSVGMNPYFAEAFNVDMDKVLAIGTPTVDYLRKENKNIVKKIYKNYPSLKEKINVLYSPTFRNGQKYDYDSLIKNTDFNKVNLIITYHSKVEETVKDRRVTCISSSEFSVFDVLKVCDYVITDYSALMVDAAIADKKILFYVYDYDEYEKNNGINLNLLKDFSKITSKSAKKIMDIINKNQYDNESYLRFKEMYTPHIEKTSTQEVMNLIKRCLDEKSN